MKTYEQFPRRLSMRRKIEGNDPDNGNAALFIVVVVGSTCT